MNLVLETRDQENKTTLFKGPDGGVVMMSPPIDQDYWGYRVKLSDTQAIVAFPKYSGWGCGFAVEEDGNTNLPIPYCAPQEVFEHIIHNKGDDAISDAAVFDAIRMVWDAVKSNESTNPPALEAP